MNYLLPTIIESRFINGGVIQATGRCLDKYDKPPCAHFYKWVKEQPEGFYLCPSGYTVYNHRIEGKAYICTGMRVKKHYKKNNAKPQNEDEVISIPEKMFFSLLCEQDKYIHIQRNDKDNREIVKDLLHDVRKVDSLVKSKSEAIIREYEHRGELYREIIQRVRNICAMEELIACKYSVYDLTSNIEVLSIGSTTPVNIYKKFDKVRYILTGYKNRNTNIVFNGETTFEYNINISYSDILPFLIMENAVKYTVGDHEVEGKRSLFTP